jgi:hypothetical protein
MIEKRLEEAGLQGACDILARAGVMRAIADIRKLFAIGSDTLRTIYEKSFANRSVTEIAAWLQSLGIHECIVEVYWVAEHEAIRVDFEVLLVYLDRLWYPSADDLWVTNVDKTWLIEITHEETVRFCALSKPGQRD